MATILTAPTHDEIGRVIDAALRQKRRVLNTPAATVAERDLHDEQVRYLGGVIDALMWAYYGRTPAPGLGALLPEVRA